MLEKKCTTFLYTDYNWCKKKYIYIVDIYKNNKQPSTHFKNCKLKRSNFLLDKEKRILIIFRLI